MNGQLCVPAAVSPGREPSCTHWIGGRLGPRTGLEAVVK
jgi:hypothetical protein